ncbi:MAG: PQQ-binding-like beta-propeller repeat protein [Myxococcota bacterium]
MSFGCVGLLLLCSALAARGEPPATADWPVTGGDAGGARFSKLADIDRTNVGKLERVWSYHHGDFYDGGWLPDYVNKGTAMETTPIVVDGRLIFTTPMNRVIALDPETGRELWTFDPGIDTDRRFANMVINRGVAYWRGADAGGRGADAGGRGGGPPGPAAKPRVFLGTLDARLLALDAATGERVADFGTNGEVDLTQGIAPLTDPWEYNVTSPPLVVGDVVVVGSSIADLVRAKSPPGDVRAFDARSGVRLWTFKTLLRADDGGLANVWTTMSADAERGLVYLPVSTVGPDFYGHDRPGDNLYSDSLVVVRAQTGERVWHFQTVHHGLFDYDLAAQPNLVRVTRDGVMRDAVAQATKSGFVFLFDRATGEPLFPIEERAVPASDVPGEHAAPTQPVPLAPPPLVPQKLGEADLYAPTPEHLEGCRAQLRALRNDGLFTPPTERGSLLYPFTGGGANWSGASFDESTATLFVPVNNLAHVIKLVALPESNRGSDDVVLHSLFGAAYWWLTGRGTGLRYHTERTLFADDGVPCNAPPWGLLVAVDLAGGTIRWSVPAGELDGVRGLHNYGPPLATAGGLVFHSGTNDQLLRAHDAATGDVLARFELPAGLARGPGHVQAAPRLEAVPGDRAGRTHRQGQHARRLGDRVRAARLTGILSPRAKGTKTHAARDGSATTVRTGLLAAARG